MGLGLASHLTTDPNPNPNPTPNPNPSPNPNLNPNQKRRLAERQAEVVAKGLVVPAGGSSIGSSPRDGSAQDGSAQDRAFLGLTDAQMAEAEACAADDDK